MFFLIFPVVSDITGRLGELDIGDMKILIKRVDSVKEWRIPRMSRHGFLAVPDYPHYGAWGGFKNRYEIYIARHRRAWMDLAVLLHEMGHVIIFLMPRVNPKTNKLMWKMQSGWDKWLLWRIFYRIPGFRL
jgi:hypothetical protein